MHGCEKHSFQEVWNQHARVRLQILMPEWKTIVFSQVSPVEAAIQLRRLTGRYQKQRLSQLLLLSFGTHPLLKPAWNLHF